MAGPPVEVQVRVNTGGSVAGSVSNWKMISSGIVTWPVGGKDPLHKYGMALMSPTVSISMLLSITRISSFHKLPFVTLIYIGSSTCTTFTSLDHWDGSLSKLYTAVYSGISIWIGLVGWYTIYLSY